MSDAPLRPAVLVIVQNAGRVLLATHRYHQTDLPVLIAGMIEDGESAEEAARREVAEETGLKITLEGILGTYPYRDDRQNLLMIAFLASSASAELVLDDELTDAAWHDPGDLPPWPPEWPIHQVFRDYRSRVTTA